MDELTRQRLNTINKLFYQTTAQEFDATRGTPWPGWAEVLPYIRREPNGDTFSVLDVGCGNGRFGAYLGEQLQLEIDYHGIDNNPELLEIAGKALKSVPGMASTLERRDVVMSPPEVGQFDLVAVFGLMHHIPGFVQRQALVKQLAERVKPGGYLAFACWRFYEYTRFKKRLIDWPDDLAGVVERHDYLLDWRRGEVAWRYCHYVDDVENRQLIDVSGLELVKIYRADGTDNATNCYSLLKRSEI